MPEARDVLAPMAVLLCLLHQCDEQKVKRLDCSFFILSFSCLRYFLCSAELRNPLAEGKTNRQTPTTTKKPNTQQKNQPGQPKGRLLLLVLQNQGLLSLLFV